MKTPWATMRRWTLLRLYIGFALWVELFFGLTFAFYGEWRLAGLAIVFFLLLVLLHGRVMRHIRSLP